MDGKLVCLGSQGTPLSPAPDAHLGPVAETAAATTAAHPDFQHLTAVRIAASDLGYRMTGVPKETAPALKKLASPLTKRATFRVKLRASPGAAPDKPRNGRG